MSVDLEAIRKRDEAATPGPWQSERDDAEYAVTVNGKLFAGWLRNADDADFIAHARTDVPVLLAEIARLEGERDEAIERAKDDAVVQRIIDMPSEEILRLVPPEQVDADALRCTLALEGALRRIAESALAACREENERLREGLKPFADVADFMESETSGLELTDELSLVCKSEAFEDVLFSTFEVQTFRRARALVEGGGDV